MPGQSLIHGEDHALWVDPDDPNHLIIGGDGGVSISWDRGLTWDFRNNMPIGAVLRDRRRQEGAVHGLRRPAGQRRVVRAERRARSQRHRESRRLEHRRRRRLLREVRSERRELRVRRVAERQRLAREPDDARADAGEARRRTWRRRPGGAQAGAAAARRCAATGTRRSWCRASIPRVVYIGAQHAVPLAGHGATWTAISPDLTTGHRSGDAADDGRAACRRPRCRATTARRRSPRSRRSASRRSTRR